MQVMHCTSFVALWGSVAFICSCTFDDSITALGGGDAQTSDANWSDGGVDAASADAGPMFTSLEPSGPSSSRPEIGNVDLLKPQIDASCPEPSVVFGLRLAPLNSSVGGNAGGYCRVALLCADLELNGATVTRSLTEQAVPLSSAQGFGSCGGIGVDTSLQPENRLECGPQQVATGFFAERGGAYGSFTTVGLHCASLTANGEVQPGDDKTFLFSGVSTSSAGSSRCESSMVVTSMLGRSGYVLDSASVQCQMTVPAL